MLRSRLSRLLTVAVLSCSCGYRFTAPGGPLPQGIRAVRVPVFSNATPEPSAETLFTQSLREQLQRAGRLGGDAAEARIDGTLLLISSAPMIASAGKAPTYRLTVLVDLKLFKGSTLVSAAQVQGDEDVLTGGDITKGGDLLLTEANRLAGLRRLADSMMREGYERLCSGW